MTELRVEEQPPEFEKWVADQDLNDREKQLWNFHRWMRQETDLSSGSIVDYRKYVAQYLDDNGELMKDLDDLGRHERAAVNKFRDFAKQSGEEK